MSTSDQRAQDGAPNFAAGDVSAIASEVARLATRYFAGHPGGELSGAALGAGLPSGDMAPRPTNPHFGPNALNVGAGGFSPALSAPPLPGFVQTPPIASAPLPKESDLRSVATLLADQAGATPSHALAIPGDSTASTPYFMQLAGLPGLPGDAKQPFAALPTGTSAPALPTGTSAPALPTATSTPALPTDGAFLVPLDGRSAGSMSGVPPQAAVPSASAAHGAHAPTSAGPVGEFPGFAPEVVSDSRSSRSLFDANAIRRDFPILEERVRGRRLVWLDNGATTQKPRSVIERLSYFYEHENSNIHRGAHTLAARATDAYEAARDKVRRYLNAPSAQEIVFVRGTTEGINLVAKSWGARHINRGDEILITWLEHHANIVPWQQLCSERGARLCVAPVDSQGQVILEEYEKLLSPRTRLVSFTHVSNALGTIVPAKEMVAMAHRHGATVLVDGAQAVSHMPVDVQDLDADFYVFSGHKVFGPTGIGAVFGKRDILEQMPPWQGGGNMIADVTFEKTTYQPAPGRFEAGTGNIGDAVGLGAALDYVSSIGIENISRYEHELLLYGTERLSRVPGLTLIGTAPDKAGVLSFVLDGHKPEDVGAALDQEGIAVRAGHHCAQPILRRFGHEATVRATLAPYNTHEDLDALTTVLERLQSGRPGRALKISNI